MPVEFLTTDIRTSVGTFTLRMFDERSAPTSLDLSIPPDDPVKIRWGESRSAGYGDWVTGSYVDLVFQDPQDHFRDLFGGVLDEINFRVVIERPGFFWQGRVQQSLFRRSVADRTGGRTRSIRVYDRLGALQDQNRVRRPETKDIEEALMQLLFPAQPEIPIIFYPDLEPVNVFDGSVISWEEIYPSTRNPTQGRVGDTVNADGEEVEDEGIAGDNRREQLENLCEQLGCRCWMEPKTGAWHVVHRSQIGQSFTATKIESNGYPLDSNATPSINRSYDVSDDTLVVPRGDLRDESDDEFETIHGVRTFAIERERNTIIENATFRVYEYESSGQTPPDFKADFPFWTQSGDNRIYKVNPTALTFSAFSGVDGRRIAEGYPPDYFRPLDEWIAFIIFQRDVQANIEQSTGGLPAFDEPVYYVVQYKWANTKRDNSGDNKTDPYLKSILEFTTQGGTTLSGSNVHSLSPTTAPVGFQATVEVGPVNEPGSLFVRFEGGQTMLKIDNVTVFPESAVNRDPGNFTIDKVVFRPTGGSEGREDVTGYAGSLYDLQSKDALKAKDSQTKIDDWAKEEDVERPFPIKAGSDIFGKTYEDVEKYRAVDLLSQRRPGLEVLGSLLVENIVTPRVAIETPEGDDYIFGSGRTFILRDSDLNGCTVLEDVQVPSAITSPIDDDTRPETPGISLNDYAEYQLTHPDTDTINGYRLYRRNAPNASETQVEDDPTTSSPYVITDPSPVSGLNFHVATAYNSRGESGFSGEVLQLTTGWYGPGNAQYEPNSLPSPTERSSSGVVFDDKLYVFGGADSDGAHARCYRLDIYANSWTKLPDYPAGATEGLFASPYPPGDHIRVGGGLDGSGNLRNSVYSFDPAAGSWASLNNMPTGRAFAAADYGVSGNTPFILVHGGENGSGSAQKDVQRFNQNGSWTALSDAPFANARHQAATKALLTQAGWLYFGGTANPSAVYLYDMSDANWTQLASIPTGVEAHGLAYNTDASEIYLVGGISGGSKVNAVQAYDVEGDSWSQLTTLPSARSWPACAFASPSVILAVAGNDGSITDLNEAYVR